MPDLKKATITPMDTKGNKIGEPVTVLFNPSEYTIEKNNQFEEMAVGGSSVPVTQFVNGNARTLNMSLFFDTYEEREDVRKYVDKLAQLAEINGGTHSPPICEFTWGSPISFKMVLSNISQKFTMFLDSGIPVRATATVTFKEYISVEDQIKKEQKQSSDRTKFIVTKLGESLWEIAGREYNNPALWRLIADINNINNPRILETGKTLIIPPLD